MQGAELKSLVGPNQARTSATHDRPASLESDRVVQPESIFLGIAVFLGYAAIGWLHVSSFRYGKADTALWGQCLWHASRLEAPVSTVLVDQGYNGFLGQHFMPVGFLYSLVMLVAPGPMVLAVLYSLSTAVAVIPLYIIAYALVKNKLTSGILVLLYLAAYVPLPVHFYFEDLVLPWLSLAILYTIRRRFAPALCLWIISLMFKEYLALGLVMMGLGLVIGGERKTGISWIVLGGVYFAVVYFWVMPAFQAEKVYFSVFAYLGSTEQQIYLTFFTKPWIWLSFLLRKEFLFYLLFLLLPTGFLALWRPKFLLAVLPLLVINGLVSGHDSISNIKSHYTTLFTPLVFASLVMGLRRGKEFLEERWRLKRGLAILVIGLVLVNIANIRYVLFDAKRAVAEYLAYQQHSTELEGVMALIPHNANVMGTDELSPYLFCRDTLYISRQKNMTSRSQYIILDYLYKGHGAEHFSLKDIFISRKDLYTTEVVSSFQDQRSRDSVWLYQYGFRKVISRGSVDLFREEQNPSF